MKALIVTVLGLALSAAACSNSSTTAPSTTTTTTTPAAPTMTETFRGTLTVGGTSFYSFSVGQYGTVNVTLNSVTGPFIPPTVFVSLALGTPSGAVCSGTTTQAQAGSSPQITGSYNPGVFCVAIADLGNLFGPAAFTITIAHP